VTPPGLVLAYHGLAALPRADDPTGLMVPPDQFRRDVERLRGRGYEFVTQAEFARRLLEGGGPPRGVCSLTFDDGSVDNHELFPTLLPELGVPATVFVCPNLLGRPYPWLPAADGIRFMDADEVRELARMPMVEIGSHTMDHAILEHASAEDAYRELRTSKDALEELLGEEVRSFAYPKGLYSPECPPAAARAGYLSAVTTGDRGSWEAHELRRESPDPLDGRLTFELKARGLYYRVRSSPPARMARWATRPLRHRRGRLPP
jgi:peptidoglycan/xylan/chitin deacetylase (PgdA/CDA1 family)